jgi:hypothetical protein
MGRVVGSILGNVNGKVGNIVGASWKGVPYFRALVIPANPQTAAQTDQRTKFASIVSVGTQILSTIVQPYWDFRYKKQSGFNGFCQANLNAMADEYDPELFIMSQGSLEPLVTPTAVYNAGNGRITISWAVTTNSNGLDSDNVAAVVLDTSSNFLYLIDDGSERQSLSYLLDTRIGGAAGDFECFVFCYRDPTVLPYIQSTSQFVNVT